MTQKTPKSLHSTDATPRAFDDTPEGVDESRVQGTLETLAQEAEAMRLRFMVQVRDRRFMMLTLGLIAAFVGAAGFGWFFLIHFNLPKGVACLVPAIVLPLLLRNWSVRPIETYRRDFKRLFLPRLARAFGGGLQFYPRRGISQAIIRHSGLVKDCRRYSAEDCFAGTYKGVKVIFSEGKFNGQTSKDEFRGLLVLLETPEKMFGGHTILTSDTHLARSMAATRWKTLNAVPMKVENPAWNRFALYSDAPEEAGALAGERLLKELCEAADAFGGSKISASFFGGKYAFIMLPNDLNMFEPSAIYEPVTIHSFSTNLKREIARILEIIDIFDIYKVRK